MGHLTLFQKKSDLGSSLNIDLLNSPNTFLNRLDKRNAMSKQSVMTISLSLFCKEVTKNYFHEIVKTSFDDPGNLNTGLTLK